MSEQEFIIPPADYLEPTQVFDKGCYETRLKQLTEMVLAKLIEQDMKQFALEYKKQFQEIPLYPYEEARVRFYEKARGEAQKIIEAERHKVVEARKDYIKTTLNLIIRQAKLLVFTDKGKGKIYKKREAIEGVLFKDDTRVFRDVFYFEDDNPAGRERVIQIAHLQSRLGEFEDYVPYMDAELQKLYAEAKNLLDIEVVDADAKA
jgi:hypothetical protein